MYLIGLFPLVIWIEAVGNTIENLPIRLAAVAVLALGAVMDAATGARGRMREGTASGVGIVALYVISQTLFAVESYFEDVGELISVGSTLRFGMLPLAMMAAAVRTRAQATVGGIPLLVWSVFLVALGAVVLSTTARFAGLTEEGYGRAISSSQQVGGAFRRLLPGFPGLVSGGVFGGLLVSLSASMAVTADLTRIRLICAGMGITGVVAVLLSDVRSNLVVIPVAILTTWMFSKDRRRGMYLGVVVTAGTLCLPIIYPALSSLLYSLGLSEGLAMIGRNQYEDVLSLSGRREIWAVSIDALKSGSLSLLGEGARGEAVLGLYTVLPNVEYLTEGFRSAFHAHNLFLNQLLCGGVLRGGAFLVATFYVLSRSTRLRKENIPYFCGMISVLLFGMFESLLSPQYVYFHGVFVSCLLYIILDPDRVELIGEAGSVNGARPKPVRPALSAV